MTVLIGLLPGYETIGVWAPILLVLLRLLQGFGAGAELAGAITYIAEYTPTPEQQRRLLAEGCAEAQGYLFGRPMPEAEFARALASEERGGRRVGRIQLM